MGTPGGMPDLVSPMQASAGTGQPPGGADWVVELAWTGHRCIAYVERGRVRLRSSGDVSMTATYPELATPLQARAPRRGMVLDGTLVARGEEHAPRARLLARRSGRQRPSAETIRAVPVDFQVADLLWLDGHWVTELPYRDRRGLLDRLGFDAAPVWSTSPLPVSELGSMLRIAEAKGVEALHARHLAARYKPGGRSQLWVKVPVPRTRQVVVGGWTPTGDRGDAIASLLLGVPGPDGLRYVGRVGVVAEQRRQVAGLRELRTEHSPFTGKVPGEVSTYAIWVQPRLVGLVEFTGFGGGGRLRLPRWQGLIGPADMDEGRWAVPPRTEPAPVESRPVESRPAQSQPRPAQPRPAQSRPAGPRPDRPQAAGHQAAGHQAGGHQAGGHQAGGHRPAEPVAGSAPVELPAPAQEPPAAPAPLEERRLEQHFVYNSLNTIASLIRSDPTRARDLLLGFADLSRATDQPAGAQTTLGRELEAVGGYLQLERARFGKRLRVEIAVPADLHGLPVEAGSLVAAVRAAVQRDIEPVPEGGVLRVAAGPAGPVTITGGDGPPVAVALPG